MTCECQSCTPNWYDDLETGSPSSTASVPPTLARNCRIVRRSGKPRGLECSGGGRLDDRLAALVRAGKLTGMTFDDIDLLQRIANVESGGQVQSLNTWDTGIVSLGFLQGTLRYVEL